jgi:CubicO group peptidase (beta-lactamase class C family)
VPSMKVDQQSSPRRRPGSRRAGSASLIAPAANRFWTRLGPGLRRGDGKWLIAALLSLATPAHAAEPTTYQRALAAGYKALFLCEGIFTAGRTQAQVEALELTGIYPDYQPLVATQPATVDRGQGNVTVTFDPALPPRLAEWLPRFGCTLAPIGAKRIAFPPALHGVHPPGTADSRPWPTGDARIAPKPTPALSAAAIASFGATYGDGARTTGLIVVRDGSIMVERYGEGFGPFTANRTWSVAKSLTGTLIGTAALKFGVNPFKPAMVPEWQTLADPRAGITLDQLLRMTSGLHSTSSGNRTDALYMGATTVTQEATHWPIEALPGTRFRYANNDTVLAVRAVRAAIGDDNIYRQWPADSLLFPIGMQHTRTGIDWQGNFILSSQVWSTARDLARLGLLWLNDGVWQGERILPEGWMKYMTTPSGPQPAEGPGYGATLWLFGPKQGLPEGSYAAQGNRGQYIMVVPSHKLVIVRRGEDPHGSRFDIAKFTADVIAALK